MTAFLSNLIFLNPWLLAALAALPALWFLLRLMPPAPKHVFLPSAAFLMDLVPEQKTPSHTPWWILLLRLLIAALVIFAFARPVLNPSDDLSGNGRVRILIENGWGAADVWDTQIKTARDLLAQAEREGREVFITTTAPIAGQKEPANFGSLTAADAEGILNGLAPLPWPSDYVELRVMLKNDNGVDSFFLTNGIKDARFDALLDMLDDQGQVKVYTPLAENLPIALQYDTKNIHDNSVRVLAPSNIPDGLPLTPQSLGENGRVLGLQSFVIDDETRREPITLDIPEILRGDLRSVKLAERQSAGSTLLLGEHFLKKTIGIVSPTEDAEARPFIEASYYLTRALEPYADIETGNIDGMIKDNLSMIILPDIGAINTTNLNRLEDWVKRGGLLLRFAGPNMASGQSENYLTPVPLRSGTRAMDGALTWEQPPKLAPFAESSPFYGIDIHEEITVRQQLLAEPTQDLPQKTWASLADGTPLITASPLDDGMLVMVHTTASPDWSDLPLSGLFVQLLSRMVQLAGAAPETLQDKTGVLQPIVVLDGFGRLQDPDSNMQNIKAAEFEETVVSSSHPPGIYGRGAVREVLNLGPQIERLTPIEDLPIGVSQGIYDQTFERDLMPPLLMTALVLLLIDWLVMLILSFNFSSLRRVSAACVLLLLFTPHIVYADVQSDMKYADGLYLAYFKGSDQNVNTLTQAGLESLAKVLARRTSAEPQGVAALNPDTDELSFFPLIYWPLSPGAPKPSDQALSNIQAYLDYGGTILIDTRDPSGDTSFLQNVLGSLDTPPLAPINKDHVLGKSFYLLNQFPGRYNDGTLWVESGNSGGRDGVSSVIIGSNDWASAWAESSQEYGGNYYRSGPRSRQNEMAARFGVNVMMYALTGNYKSDQVHVDQILERLGQ